jgi:trigger factor
MTSLDVSVETTTGLERKLKFKIPNEQIDKEELTRLNEMGPKVQLKGFSGGRDVPISVLKKRYGKQVRSEVIRSLANTSLTQAIKEQDLKIAGIIAIDFEPNQQQEEGSNTKIVATLEVMPDIEIKSFKGVELEQINANISEENVSAALETMSKQHASWVNVEREAKNGDRLDIDFVGKIDNEEFKGGKHENFMLELGSNSLIEGFESGLIGAKAGEQVELELTFPEDYHSKDVAGKLVNFSVKVNTVSEPKLPELDDEFAKQFGVEEGGIEALKQAISENLERELKQRIQNRNKEVVLNKLIELNPIELPKTLVDNEIQRMREQFEQQFKQMQYQRGRMPKISDDRLRGQAERRVNLALLLLEYARINEIKADPDKVEQKLASLAQVYEEPEEVIAWYKANKEQMVEIESSVVEDQVIEKMVAEANVIQKTVSYDEMMKPQQKP